MRSISENRTADGRTTYKVRFRDAGIETSETFARRSDAEMFRDILGNGKGDRLRQARAWLETRRAGQSSDWTFASWFEHYIEQLTGVTERTRSDYHSLRRRYLASLDHLPLEAVARTHVTQIVNTMDRDGRAPKTIKQAIYLLSTCLALAIDEGHINANPCRRIRLPEQSFDITEPRFLTHQEAARLIVSMPEHYRPLVTFLVGTGMRWSEATAIEGRHVNIDAGTVRVEQAWKRVPGKGLVLGPPKSRRARRTVNAATAALMAIEPLVRGPRDLVFTTPSGRPISHSNFYTNIWSPARRQADLDPAPRIHDTRHTHASWLISAGISLEAVQDQLGHESIETTRKVYAHLLPAVGIAAGKAASNSMREALAHVPRLLLSPVSD